MRKIGIIGISAISSIILFIILIWVEKKAINYEPTSIVLVAVQDITENQELQENMFKISKMPLSLSLEGSMNVQMEDIIGKFARENIHKGQVIFEQDIGEKEALRIIEAEEGLEKIAISIKKPENGVAYQIRVKDKVNLYFTGRYASMSGYLEVYGADENSIQTFKIFEDQEVLGVFDRKGVSMGINNFEEIDTVVFAVSPEKAQIINNLRSQGIFDITG